MIENQCFMDRLPKNRNLSGEETQKMQKFLNGTADLNSIDFSKKYKCNCNNPLKLL